MNKPARLLRFSLRARRFFQVKRWSAVGLWVCFCLPGLTPAEYGQSDQVSDLILQLQSPQSATKANAAYKLSEIKDPRAVEPLIATLKGGAPANVRAVVVYALGQIADPRAVEALSATLLDHDVTVRQNAARALAAIKDPSTAAPLIVALRDPDARVRLPASMELGLLKDPRAVEPLIAALQDTNLDVRKNAAGSLGLLKDPRAVEPLIATLQDTDPYVRQNAAASLGRLKDPRAVEPLIAALQDTNANVRHNAIAGLADIQDPRAVQPLTAALQDSDPENREMAAGALRRIGGRGAPPIAADSGVSTSAQKPGVIPIITGNGASVLFLRFSPDGGELARVTQFFPVMLMDANGYRKARTFPVGMRMVAYSPDGTKIATAEGRDGARVWKANDAGEPMQGPGAAEVRLLNTPLEVLQTPSQDPTQTLFWTEFSPDGKRLITTHSYGHVKVWNTSSWAVEQEVNLAETTALTAAFAPDGKTIVIGDTSGKLHQWDLATKTWRGNWDTPPGSGAVTGVAFSPDGKTLVTTHQSAPGNVLAMLWQNNVTGVPDRITGGAWRASAEWTAQLEPGFGSAAFSKDGKLLALGGRTIKLLDPSTWREIRTIELPEMTHREATTQGSQIENEPYASTKYPALIMALAFSPDSRTLAAGALSGAIYLLKMNP